MRQTSDTIRLTAMDLSYISLLALLVQKYKS
jgi:hypothetical protein